MPTYGVMEFWSISTFEKEIRNVQSVNFFGKVSDTKVVNEIETAESSSSLWTRINDFLEKQKFEAINFEKIRDGYRVFYRTRDIKPQNNYNGIFS
jgi:hypothetical protein